MGVPGGRGASGGYSGGGGAGGAMTTRVALRYPMNAPVSFASTCPSYALNMMDECQVVLFPCSRLGAR